jgi:hypothetical protein
VLLSPKLSNEDLLVLRHLFTQVFPVKVLGAGSLEPEQPEDTILRKADPHPNSWAVRALGFEVDVRQMVRAPQARALLIIGDDPVGWDASLASDFARFELVAGAFTNRNATCAALSARNGILLPLATFAEYAGTFTNFEGRVQRFAPALSPYGASRPAYELGIELAASLRRPFWPRGARPERVLEAIWDELLPTGSTLPRFEWKDVPQSALVPTPTPTAQRTTKGYLQLSGVGARR